MASINEEMVANLKGGDLKKFQVFQQFWRTNHSKQGQGITERSQIACNELVQEEGLERLRSRGIVLPRDQKPWFSRTLREKDNGLKQQAISRGEDALNSLCRAYEGIVRCYSNVASPYGKKATEKEITINNDRVIKEQGGHLWEFYQSFKGEGVLQ